MAIASINPATGEKIKTFEPLSTTEIEAKVALAEQTFQDYRNTTFQQRANGLQRAAEILEERKTEFARLMTLEMGKPLKEAMAEVTKCAWVCRFYAENAEQFLQDIPAQTDASRSYVRCLPLGLILAVMPWNFPFWQVFRFAAPALMAGNVGLLKHASNVPQCALAIEEILHKAGFPTGAFQTLLIGASHVAPLVADDRIKAATLTGSELAGASLAAAAGQAIKKTVLELGGTDPFIVLDSADLSLAVDAAVTARLLNNGQSCIAAKRFILHEAIAESFTAALVERFKAIQVGDPLLESTQLGPLATCNILQELDSLVQACVDKGAKVLVGGQPLVQSERLPPALRQGNFYPATILSDIPPGTPADSEEFFGPVALLFSVKSLEEAITLANATPLGLGASAWTNNTKERDKLINSLEAGAVFINGLVKSDPRLPFGGIKRSGYGRELGLQGIQEFVNLKTVWIR